MARPMIRILGDKRAEAFVRKMEQRGAADLARVEKPVRRIVEDVRKNGDAALRRYAQKWDGLAPKQSLRASEKELQEAWNSVSDEFRTALETAAGNIRRYCEWQKPQEWERSSQTG